MNSGDSATALGEWRRYWPVAASAAVGYSMLGLQTYAIGPFVAPLEHAFGWSRAQVMWGLTLSNLLGVLFNLAIGVAIDRLGPRRVGLAGLFVKAGAFALLASATGTLLDWSLLWVLVAFGAMLVQSTVWSSAVASRFDKGRGLALAMALSGTSLCAAVAPMLATGLIEARGWRMALAGISGIWLAVTFPLAYLFYRGRQEELRAARPGGLAAAAKALPGLTLREGLRRPAYWRLLYGACVYSVYTLAMAPNLVPMLTEKGLGAMMAAGVASLVGTVAIAARLSAGFLLDVLPAHVVGACVFLLPVAGCGVMLLDHPGFVLLLLAVGSIGMTIGAEFDVIIYLTSRHFGLRAFGALFGGMITAGALGGAIGPVTSGWIHDRSGNYDAMLGLLMVLMAAGALLIFTIGQPKEEWGAQ